MAEWWIDQTPDPCYSKGVSKGRHPIQISILAARFTENWCEMLPRLLAFSLAEMKAFIANPPNWNGIQPGLRPVGDREGNYGTIAVTKDAGDAIQEIPTNQMDIVLESAFLKFTGNPPAAAGPHLWANTLFQMPDGFRAISEDRQRQLARNIAITIDSGDGADRRIVTFRDSGIGMTPESMPDTILSLNRRIKLSKPYTCGSFGQGGSSTYAFAKASLIASRSIQRPDVIGFTVVWEVPLLQSVKPATYFAYLVYNNQVPTISVAEAEQQGLNFPIGTMIRYYGYDFTSYPHAETLVQLFQKKQFDPPLPFLLKTWKDDDYRLMRGGRNELLTSPDTLYYNKAALRISDEEGGLELEYWVLPPASREIKRPNARFVDPHHPIVATFNGQVHGNGEGSVIDDCNLSLLKHRIVVHVNCTGIRATNFFATTRTDIRWGTETGLKVVNALKAQLSNDKRLQQFQQEAEEALRPKLDEADLEERRRHLLKELRFVNIFSENVVHKEAAPPLEPKDPPEILRFLGETPVVISPGRTKTLTFQTDAPESYRDLMKIGRSTAAGKMVTVGKLIIHQDRIRLQITAEADAKPDQQGVLQLSFLNTSLKANVPLIIKAYDPNTSDEEEDEEEKPKKKRSDVTVPLFVPVKRKSQQWMALGWPVSTKEVACSFIKDEKGIRELHYSMDYPDFKAFHQKILTAYGPSSGEYFQTSYEEHLLIGLYQTLKIFQGKTVDSDTLQLTYNTAAATAATGAYRQWREWQAAAEEAGMRPNEVKATRAGGIKKKREPKKKAPSAAPVKKRA